MFSRIKINFLLLTFILITPGFAQTDFEGKVVMRIESDESKDKKSDVGYFIKEDKIRMEMKSEQGEVVILYDQKDSKTYMIMPGQKMYMELQGIDYKSEGDSEYADKSPNINRTGEFKEINGYKCEKWLVKDEDNELEAWMTDELGSFYMMSNPMNRSTQQNWQKELQGNYFPMKVSVLEDDEKKSSMEVLSVDKTALSDDLFTVPKGFQKFDMPNMNMYKQN